MRMLPTTATRVLFFVLLAAVAMAPGCGGDDGGPVTLDNFSERLGRSFCDIAVQCGEFPDYKTCIETQFFAPLEQLIADNEAGLYDIDQDLLEECALSAASCVNEFNVSQSAVDRTLDCVVALFSGNQPDGAACNSDTQCAGGICSPTDANCQDACCAGTCATGQLNLGDAGAQCIQGAFPCNVGLYCMRADAGSPIGTCATQIQPGQPCGQANACTLGHWCNSQDAMSAGVCEPISLAGETCDGGSATRNNGCRDISTYCDAATSICETRPGPGEACSADVPCLLYSYCDGTTCQLLPQEGETCTVPSETNPNPIPCLGDLRCISGFCSFPQLPQVCTL